MTLDEIASLRPERIVISPGPGRPVQAGITLDVIKRFGPTTPLLGVCLGHQAIGMAFGGAVVRANVPMHGKTSSITHDGQGVFAGIATPLTVARWARLAGVPTRSRSKQVMRGSARRMASCRGPTSRRTRSCCALAHVCGEKVDETATLMRTMSKTRPTTRVEA